MGLAQDIVVVNQFTTRTAHGGTRGGTPGAYVERYMARDGAVEDVTPVRLLDTDDIGVRYENRSAARIGASSKSDVMRGIERADGDGGIAFGTGSLSLSADALHTLSHAVQDAFDAGKTVLKTVVSFSQGYLQRMNVIVPGEPITRRGDYRGRLDQMKLRLAVSRGMDALSHRGFDSLLWVGTVQVDTKHVHCHIAAVDVGEGRLRTDGTQRGMLTESDMTAFRGAVNHSLAISAPVRTMASNVTSDRTNARQIVRRFVSEQVARRAVPQLILASLPEDKRSWRAGSHAKSMRRANELTTTYVRGILAQPGSGWEQARIDVRAYARRRTADEGLSPGETRALIAHGEDDIVQGCVNAVYGVLKSVPDDQRTVSTSMLDLMANDVSDVSAYAASDVTAEFAFRLRTYAGRLRDHTEQRAHMHALRTSWESSTTASQASAVMHDFYVVEEEYQAMCMAKYQSFLSFVTSDADFDDDVRRLERRARQVDAMQAVLEDGSVSALEPDRAESYCRRVYGVSGGRYVPSNPDIMQTRYEHAARDLDRARDDLAARMAAAGWLLEEDVEDDESADPDDVRGNSRVKLMARRGLAYEFDDVKAVDVHDLGYDFPTDVAISKGNVDVFLSVARRRIGAYDAAMSYLRGTGQAGIVRYVMPVADVTAMRKCAESISSTMRVESLRPQSAQLRHTHTVSLDYELDGDLRQAVTRHAKSYNVSQE